MATEAWSRGHLNPGADARVSRLAPPPNVADAVVHFWIPEWDLPPGQISRQLVLSYPAINLVLRPDSPEGDVTLHGPRTGVSYRDLSGRGWAVGALLKPRAVAAVLAATCPPITNVRVLVDSWVSLEAPRLMSDVASRMDGTGSRRMAESIDLVAAWLCERLEASGSRDRDARLAGALLEFLDALPLQAREQHNAEPPRHVAEVARQLGTSTRTLERVALTYTGFTPAALIRRRRLQDAADRLRRDPSIDLTRLAIEVGYADHAHLTRDFHHVLGFTPSVYRGDKSGS